jgi:hypothetical protein
MAIYFLRRKQKDSLFLARQVNKVKEWNEKCVWLLDQTDCIALELIDDYKWSLTSVQRIEP